MLLRKNKVILLLLGFLFASYANADKPPRTVYYRAHLVVDQKSLPEGISIRVTPPQAKDSRFNTIKNWIRNDSNKPLIFYKNERARKISICMLKDGKLYFPKPVREFMPTRLDETVWQTRKELSPSYVGPIATEKELFLLRRPKYLYMRKNFFTLWLTPLPPSHSFNIPIIFDGKDGNITGTVIYQRNKSIGLFD